MSAHPDEPSNHSLGRRARAAGSVRARQAAGAVLDRVGARAAQALHDDLLTAQDQIDALREELARTRAELTAEIELLRAEVAGAAAERSGDGG